MEQMLSANKHKQRESQCLTNTITELYGSLLGLGMVKAMVNQNKTLATVEEPKGVKEYCKVISRIYDEAVDFVDFTLKPPYSQYYQNVVVPNDPTMPDSKTISVLAKANIKFIESVFQVARLASSVSDILSSKQSDEFYLDKICKSNQRISSLLKKVQASVTVDAVEDLDITLQDVSKNFDEETDHIDKCLSLKLQTKQAANLAVKDPQADAEALRKKTIQSANATFDMLSTDYVRDLRSHYCYANKTELDNLDCNFKKIERIMPLSLAATQRQADDAVSQMDRWQKRFYEVAGKSCSDSSIAFGG